MKHGNKRRKDHHPSHIATVGFGSRADEAAWISEAIRALVPSEDEGAEHDKRDGQSRGLAFSDIAILVRSSTDVRTYMDALEAAGIPAVVRAGPDLFSQPEILFFSAALAISAGHDEFWGSPNNRKSLPVRTRTVLGCEPKTEIVLKEAAKHLRRSGLAFDRDAEEAVLLAARAIHRRIANGGSLSSGAVAGLRTPGLREFLASSHDLRRVFPQQLFHFFLSEARVERWDTGEGRGQAAMFHLGALSGPITGIETPGWTSVKDYPWHVIGLFQYGAEEGRAEEQPLIVRPDAVTISTVHGGKGLEFAAVFLAGVVPRRFPSAWATRRPRLPLDGSILRKIDVDGLADNDNFDGERRLMYVAVTRAERFLFISHSGNRASRFVNEFQPLVTGAGGVVTDDSGKILNGLRYLPKEYRRELQLSTSFSDLRYYLECPHDFYLRKVLGFSPTIDQAFGYGRGVHNLLRAVHSDPRRWAMLAKDRHALEGEIHRLLGRGLFYLRYTTGEPAENMRQKGLQVVADYIQNYVVELQTLEFEPEKEFETLIDYEDAEGGALVSGAIDVVRQDDPPRVTLIDFKSGDPASDKHNTLDEDEMKLQVAIYAAAAKKELEYEPEQGLVRYLGVEKGEKRELTVPFDERALEEAKSMVARTAAKIRDRVFKLGPNKASGEGPRCRTCDFLGFCGQAEAAAYKKQRSGRV